jgi:hypothetical protein
MANVKNQPAFLTHLTNALVDTLKGSGIQAKVKSQRVPGTKLYRLSVYSPQFKKMYHSERQSLVWRVADRAISPDDQMRISMILTLTGEEAKDMGL